MTLNRRRSMIIVVYLIGNLGTGILNMWFIFLCPLPTDHGVPCMRIVNFATKATYAYTVLSYSATNFGVITHTGEASVSRGQPHPKVGPSIPKFLGFFTRVHMV